MFVGTRNPMGTWYDPSTWFTLPASLFVNQDELGKAAVRAHGIDPNTGQVMAPYADVVAKNDRVDPNDPAAVAALAKKIYADAVGKFKSDYQKGIDEANKNAFPWSTVIIGGIVIGSAYVGWKLLNAAAARV